MTSFRLLPMRWRVIWRLLRPEPGELCSGFGLMLTAMLSQFDRSVTLNVYGLVTMGVVFCFGLALLLSSLLEAPLQRRGDLAGACGLLWCFFIACTIHAYGIGPRQGAIVGMAAISFLTMLRDWDEE